MIRNACIHLNGEQPLLADLFELPLASDAVLRCTNLRSMNGKRPVFIDDVASIFFFPYLHIRFVEIPPSSMSGGSASVTVTTDGQDERPASAPAAEAEPDLEIDEDFLRRIREV